MTDSEYYSTYQGPLLTKVMVGNEDVTDMVQLFYGENHNWRKKLWTYGDIFPVGMSGLPFKCEFQEDGDPHNHWFSGTIDNPDEIFNLPLITPISRI